MYADSEEELLKEMDTFFETCIGANFRLNARKSYFYLREARFCGRIISKDGINFDPRNLDALVKMKRPSHADQLQQFICAMNWMRNGVKKFARIVSPLLKLLDASAKRAGKRTKRKLSKIHISEEWGEEHETAFIDIKKEISNLTRMSFRKEKHSMCLFTDASDHFWSATLVQTKNENMDLPVPDRQYEPLAFL